MGKSTVIATQRPSKRKKRHAGQKRRVLGYAILRLASICAAIFLVIALPYYVANKVQKGFQTLTSSTENQLVLLSSGGALTDFDQESLQSKMLAAANKGASLQNLAEIAASAAPLAKVDIIRATPNKIVIGFDKRDPKLRIMMQHQQLIDSSGFIYGKCCVIPGQDAEASLPLLEGIATIENSGIASDSRLSVIKEALVLARELNGLQLPSEKIRYQNHRGFFVTLQPDKLEISFGRAPFASKLQRLRDVLKQVERNKVSRIELDYHGKAFIRERKI